MSEYTEEAGKKLDAAMRQLFRDMRRELTPEQREAMERLLADLQSESESGEECQAAYERGKAEGLEEGKQAERGRIRGALKVERDSVRQRKERSKSAWFGLVWQEREETYDKAIKIVNQE